MLYLIFSILCSTFIFVVFKAFGKFGVNNVFAIVVNYIVAASLGFFIGGFPKSIDELAKKEWLLIAFFIGFLFITLFQIMALTAQKLGVSRVSVPVKMSVALPVVAGVWLYGESLTIWGILGIFLALIAVYLGTKKPDSSTIKSSGILLLLPLVLFFGSGGIDVVLKYAQVNWLHQNETAFFSSVIFGFAFLWGLFFAGYAILVKRNKPTLKDVFGGIILGVPNFGSIYFLLEALDKSGLQSASIYPINNVAIVGLSAIIGLVVFKEHLSKTNIFGLACGIVSIALIAYA